MTLPQNLMLAKPYPPPLECTALQNHCWEFKNDYSTSVASIRSSAEIQDPTQVYTLPIELNNMYYNNGHIIQLYAQFHIPIPY